MPMNEKKVELDPSQKRPGDAAWHLTRTLGISYAEAQARIAAEKTATPPNVTKPSNPSTDKIEE